MKKAFITLLLLCIGSSFLFANQRYQSNILGQNLGPVESVDGYTLQVDKGLRTLFLDGIPQKTITEEKHDTTIQIITKDLISGSIVSYTKKDGQLEQFQDNGFITVYTYDTDGKIRTQRTTHNDELVSFTRYYYGFDGKLSSTICKKGETFIYNNYPTFSSALELLSTVNQTFSQIEVVGTHIATSRYTGEEKTGGLEVEEGQDGSYTLINSVTQEKELYDSAGLLRKKTYESDKLCRTTTYDYDEAGTMIKSTQTIQDCSSSSLPLQKIVSSYNEGSLVSEEHYGGNELQMIVTFSDTGQIKQLFEHEALYCTMYYDTTGKKLLAIDYPQKEDAL